MEQDVRRLDVAVDDVAPMRVIESFRYGVGDLDALFDGELLLVLQLLL